jgi:rhodanese-related sulfurtransferase
MQVPEIDVDELARRRAEGAVVIDVRQPDEYDEVHVPGARLIPLADVGQRLDEVPAEGEVLVICRSGGRSRKAAEVMNAAGRQAVNVAGGTLAWIDAGHPVAHGSEPG